MKEKKCLQYQIKFNNIIFYFIMLKNTEKTTINNEFI